MSYRKVMVSLGLSLVVAAPAYAQRHRGPSGPTECQRRHDLCRQSHSCPITSDKESQAVLDPPYCRTCETEFTTCNSAQTAQAPRKRHHRRTTSGSATAGTSDPWGLKQDRARPSSGRGRAAGTATEEPTPPRGGRSAAPGQ